MRKSDDSLNATEICAAAVLDKPTRDRYMNMFRRRGLLTKQHNKSWVPFRDGVFLCRTLGLADDLKGLFSLANTSLPRGPNYLVTKMKRNKNTVPEGYRILEYNKISIACTPSTRVINATHLLKLGKNIKRQRLPAFFAAYPHIGKFPVNGNASVSGTYINFDHVTSLGEYFKIKLDSIKQVLQMAKSTALPYDEVEISDVLGEFNYDEGDEPGVSSVEYQLGTDVLGEFNYDEGDEPGVSSVEYQLGTDVLGEFNYDEGDEPGVSSVEYQLGTDGPVEISDVLGGFNYLWDEPGVSSVEHQLGTGPINLGDGLVENPSYLGFGGTEGYSQWGYGDHTTGSYLAPTNRSAVTREQNRALSHTGVGNNYTERSYQDGSYLAPADTSSYKLIREETG
ncbi:hypothetical protein B0T14DRAFT_126768 [Immersiella caudata]|uniref:Uncharacterized protein n=1 Tax=Immersiella caudata TaxID=314043 RepID=A0AA39X4E8_9PEZI|nr:hypothetical protein B0T14DRAFT_126768 [Immersiella caudata]